MARTEEDLQRQLVEWQNSMERERLKVNSEKIDLMISAKRGRHEISNVKDNKNLKQVSCIILDKKISARLKLRMHTTDQ